MHQDLFKGVVIVASGISDEATQEIQETVLSGCKSRNQKEYPNEPIYYPTSAARPLDVNLLPGNKLPKVVETNTPRKRRAHLSFFVKATSASSAGVEQSVTVGMYVGPTSPKKPKISPYRSAIMVDPLLPPADDDKANVLLVMPGVIAESREIIPRLPIRAVRQSYVMRVSAETVSGKEDDQWEHGNGRAFTRRASDVHVEPVLQPSHLAVGSKDHNTSLVNREENFAAKLSDLSPDYALMVSTKMKQKPHPFLPGKFTHVGKTRTMKMRHIARPGILDPNKSLKFKSNMHGESATKHTKGFFSRLFLPMMQPETEHLTEIADVLPASASVV